MDTIESTIEEINKNKAEKLVNTEKGISYPLVKLMRIFGLQPVEQDILIMAFAPEIDTRYERI